MEQHRSWVHKLCSVFTCRDLTSEPSGSRTFQSCISQMCHICDPVMLQNIKWKSDYTGQKHFTANAFARRQHIIEGWNGGKFKHVCSYGEKKNPEIYSKNCSLPSKMPHFSLSFYRFMHQTTNFITVHQLQTTSTIKSLLLFFLREGSHPTDAKLEQAEYPRGEAGPVI